MEMLIGGVLVITGFFGGYWFALKDRQVYGRNRFESGIATGIARERHAVWARDHAQN